MRYQFTVTDTATRFDEILPLSFSVPFFFKVGQVLTFGTQTAIVSAHRITDTIPLPLGVAPLTSAIAAGTTGFIEVDDIGRIARHLGIPPSCRGQLAANLQTYESQYPGTLMEVSGLLAELDAIEAFTNTQGLDENLYLIKAGSLEWAPGGKAASSDARRSDLKTKLMILTGADAFMATRSNGFTRVIKGFA